MICPQFDELVNLSIEKFITQYREADKLKGLATTYLRASEEAVHSLCFIPSFFDIETAVCDQLTILGKILGFPRYQCKGLRKPRFALGYCNPLTYVCACPTCNECEVEPEQGFCFGYMGDVYDPFEFTCNDDELYRRFLLCRILQRNKKFKKDVLLQALKLLFDVEDPIILESARGRVKVSINRPLTAFEKKTWHMYRSVLPVGLGVRTEILLSNSSARPFGLGAGWGQFCSSQFTTGRYI